MKKVLFLIAAAAACLVSCNRADDGFRTLFNGENWDGWYLKLKSGDEEMASKVFAIEDGVIHVFNDDFPDSLDVGVGTKCGTHGMFFTDSSYSRYIFRFEYKWGRKIANNFHEFQYDAGMYYHIIEDTVFPTGIEYQVRYDHLTDKNHTGDYWATGTDFDWTSEDGRHYAFPSEGGVPQHRRGGEHLARPTDNFNALNDGWNLCEVIVMGDKYSIHKLNGEIVNVATNLSVSEGKIGLQSETAEIFYRNIQIKEFDEIVPIEEFLGQDSAE